jgi:hypothetical protein
LLTLDPFHPKPYPSVLVRTSGFLGGCAIFGKPSYLNSLYKRGRVGHPGLSICMGAMKRFPILMRVVASVIVQLNASVLRGAP